MKHLNYSFTWDIYLLIVRLWLARAMIMGGQSILRFFSSKELRDFFENWFGNELGLPAPLLMAFLAKGTEFLCGILICAGIFTRVSAAMIAVVMFIATLVANINYDGNGALIRQDGVVTISCFLFACLLIQWGGGKYSLDRIIFKSKSRTALNSGY